MKEFNINIIMKKILTSCLSLTILITADASAFAGSKTVLKEDPLVDIQSAKYKNVIFMIPDGMSQDALTLTRWTYNNGEALNLDTITAGMVRTSSARGAITDSSNAATAMATSYKSDGSKISMRPDLESNEKDKPFIGLAKDQKPNKKNYRAPLATSLEAAKLKGKSTGLVVTCEIQNATPAAFSSHALQRNYYTTIGEQQVYQNMDVVMGGGYAYLNKEESWKKPIKESKYRTDGENMQDIIKNRAYKIVTNKKELNDISPEKDKKVWGAFADGALDREMDRNEDSQPTLAEMTKKAIDVLSTNRKGFFLMVEGSQIDWAAHANHPMGMVSEIKAFDDAVGVAIEFAQKDKDTVVICASDHGNSGISMGNANTSSNYKEHTAKHFVKYMQEAKITESQGIKVLKEGADIKAVLKQMGIKDLKEDEIKLIEENPDNAAKVLATRSDIGFTTGGHTGEDLALYIYTPDKKNRLTSTVDNTVLANYTAKLMGLDLDEASRELFVGTDELKKSGMNVNINKKDPFNVKLEVTKGANKFVIHENKNLITHGKKTIRVNGVSVYNGRDFFIPKESVDYMKKQ